MRGPTESSVRVALDELRKLEEGRQEEIAAAKEAAEAARRAAADEARARDAHLLRVAEAEARLRVEAEERAHRTDAERRLDALREELAAVRRDREALHRTIAARADLAMIAEPPRRSRSLAAAAAVASALSLAVAVYVAAREPRVVTVLESPTVPPAPTAAAERHGPMPAPAADAVADTAVPPERAHRTKRPRGSKNRPPAAVPGSTTDADRLLRDIDACERRGDLLCGTE